MNTIHTDRSDSLVDRIIRSAFPSYSGRRVQLVPSETVELSDTAWSGGSRSSYAGVSADGGDARPLPQFDPAEFGGPSRPPVVDLSPVDREGASVPFIVEHSLYRGKDMGIRIYAHPSRLAPLLPEGAELSDTENLMLYITHCLKSVGRREEWARSQPADTFDAQREALAARGFLRKSGAITNEGRNALGNWKPALGSGLC